MSFTKEQINELSKIGLETGKETNQPIEDKVDTFLDELDIIHEIDRRVQDVDEAFDLAQGENEKRDEKTSKFRILQQQSIAGLKKGQMSIQSGLGSFSKSFGLKMNDAKSTALDFITSPFGIALGVILGVFTARNIIDPIQEFNAKFERGLLDIKDGINRIIPFSDPFEITPQEELLMAQDRLNKLTQRKEKILSENPDMPLREIAYGSRVNPSMYGPGMNQFTGVEVNTELGAAVLAIETQEKTIAELIKKINEMETNLGDKIDESGGGTVLINNETSENNENSEILNK